MTARKIPDSDSDLDPNTALNQDATGPRRLDSVRMQLTLWFGGLVALTFLCAALYVGHMTTVEVRKSVADHQYMTAQSAANLLSAQIQERYYDIDLVRRTLAQSSQPLSGAAARLALSRLQKVNNAYAWIGVTDAKGNVVQATSDVLLGVNVSTRPWFEHASRDMYVGNLHEAVLLANLLSQPNDRRHPLRFFDIAGPIVDAQGRLKGVLSSHLHWSWVTSVVRSVLNTEPDNTAIDLIIADNNGDVLYPEDMVGSRLPSKLDLSRRDQVVRWSDEQPYLVSSASLSLPPAMRLGWHIVVRESLSSATQVVRSIQGKLIAFGVLALAIFIGLAYRISRRLSRPIEELAAVARSIEAGNPPATLPHDAGSPEIASLLRAFQSMINTLLRRERELAALNADLEHQVADRTQQLQQANEELARLSNSDGLTGLHNRRYFDARLQIAHAQALQNQSCYGVVLVDADHFKRVNDDYGHLVGDDVLKALARVMTNVTRDTDVVARYGGEEFVVLVPYVRADADLIALGEKICQAARHIEVVPGVMLSVSVGVARSALSNDASPLQVLDRADQALYRAKQSGRDRVERG